MKFVNKLCLGLIFTGAATQVFAAEKNNTFNGWEDMRIIKDASGTFRLADFNGNGRSSIVCFRRSSALVEIYELAKNNELRDKKHSNDLPLSNDIKKSELKLKRAARAFEVIDADNDGKAEIYVITPFPFQFSRYQFIEGKWEETFNRPLLQSDSNSFLLKVRPSKSGPQAYILGSDGIQHISLKEGCQPHWLQPRKRDTTVSQLHFGDNDGDGFEDLLLEYSGALSLMRGRANGDLAPAVALKSEGLSRLTLFDNGQGLPLISAQSKGESGVISLYDIKAAAKTSPYGKQNALPINSSSWASIVLDGRPSLIKLDGKQPLLHLMQLEKDGWNQVNSFPVIQDAEQIAAIQIQQGDKSIPSLVFRLKGADDIYLSSWKDGSFTFPRPLLNQLTLAACSTDKAKKFKILDMGRRGEVIWWTRQADKQLELFTWQDGQAQPQRTILDIKSDSVKQSQWLGGTSIAYVSGYKKDLLLASINGAKTDIRTISRLKGKQPNTIQRLPEKGGQLYMIEKGYFTLLDENMEPSDMVILPEENKAKGVFVSQGKIYVNSDKVYQLKKNKSGRYKVSKTLDIDANGRDDKFGFFNRDSDSLSFFSEGKPLELSKFADYTATQSATPQIKDPMPQRVWYTDITGDDKPELIFADYRHHYLFVMNDEAEKGEFKDLIKWQIFDNRKYPYNGGRSRGTEAQPRTIGAADLDGDGLKELVIASHDKILLYLSKEISK